MSIQMDVDALSYDIYVLHVLHMYINAICRLNNIAIALVTFHYQHFDMLFSAQRIPPIVMKCYNCKLSNLYRYKQIAICIE